MVKNNSKLATETMDLSIGLGKVDKLDNVSNPPKKEQKRKYIKKKSTSKSDLMDQSQKNKPKKEKLNSEMYIDFPQNSLKKNQPSKITGKIIRIVELMGMLSTFVLNSTLLRTICGLHRGVVQTGSVSVGLRVGAEVDTNLRLREQLLFISHLYKIFIVDHFLCGLP
jgi:hypothetical protein